MYFAINRSFIASRASLLALVLAPLAVAACSSTSSTEGGGPTPARTPTPTEPSEPEEPGDPPAVTPSSDASADAKPGADAGADGGAPLTCQLHAREGALLSFDQTSPPVPTAAGGLLADGTYHLVKINYFGPAGSRPSSKFGASFYLKDGRYEWETTDQVGDLSSAGKISFSGSTMTWQKDCGEAFGPFTYSATAQGFKFYQVPVAGITLEFVMDRK